MLLLAVGIYEVLIAIMRTYFLNGGNPFGIVNFARFQQTSANADNENGTGGRGCI